MKKRSFSAILLVVFSLFIATSIFADSGSQVSSSADQAVNDGRVNGGDVEGVYVPD